jgi:dTDP-4-amino-4,6-dideoxygalactose transaminase
MDSLEKINESRRQIAFHYKKKLDGMKYLKASEVTKGENCHLYTVNGYDRDDLQKYLDELGIQTIIHYQFPAHKMPVEKANFYPNPLHKTEEHCKTVLSLPCWYGMKETQADLVVRAIRKFYHE